MRIGWIGLGVMGRPMVTRLLAAGHEVRVSSRRESSAIGVLERGAVWSSSARECAAACDVLVTMLPNLEEFNEVVWGAAGILASDPVPTVLIDMSTGSPELAAELAREGEGRGFTAVDAPVSGGPDGAANGTLSIMVGASSNGYQRALPILREMGVPVLFGLPGAGQRAKLVNQIIVAGTMAGLSEAFSMIEREGMDGALFHRCIRHGMSASSLLEFVWPRVLANDMAPGFKMGHFIKDLVLAISEADSLQLKLPITEAVLKLCKERATTMGDEVGTQALVAVREPG